MIKVKFANGKVIDAPAKGKVLARDIRLTPKQLDDLYEANIKATKHESNVDFDKIREIELENRKYYETLPKWFNYNKKGEIVNKFKDFREFAKARFKRKK